MSILAQRFPFQLKMSRNGVWILELRLISPKLWLLRDVSVAIESKNVALSSFAQRFRVSEA